MRFARYRHLPAGSACAVLLLTLACSAGQGPILIGLAGPFTDSVGAPMRRAAELAVEQANRSGGINGRRIELVIRDDFGDPDSAVTAATALEAAGVVAVIGHVYSGTTIAAAPVYNDPRDPVVQISPSSTAPEVTGAGDYTFRVCPSDLQYGAALARFAAERMGFRHGTILYLNDPYGRGLRQSFLNSFTDLGGAIDDIDPYLGGDPDVSAYLDRLSRRGMSQFIFLGGNYPEAEATLRAAASRKIRIPLLGGDGLEGLEKAGTLAEGSYIANGYLANFPSAQNREFVRGYADRYPGAAPPSQAAAATYDILFLLRRVIGQVGTDRKKIRDGVAAIGLTAPVYDGVTGEIAFDEQGDVPKQRVVIGKVRNGQVIAVEGQ
ncbi:MAG: ABC transporter substrate-binding protein [Gemmatimonadales bacterium]